MSNSANFKINTGGIVNAAGDEDMATGDMKLWPSEAIPAGWLVRDGRALSRATFAALFAVLGTRYGAGDGATTFNIPDDRGIFERCADLGKGVDAGRAVGSLQEPSLTNIANGTRGSNEGVNVDSFEYGNADVSLHFDNYEVEKTVMAAAYVRTYGDGQVKIMPYAMRPSNRAYVPLIKY